MRTNIHIESITGPIKRQTDILSVEAGLALRLCHVMQRNRPVALDASSSQFEGGEGPYTTSPPRFAGPWIR